MSDYKNPDFVKFCEEQSEHPLEPWQKKMFDEVYEKCKSNGTEKLKLLPHVRGDGYSLTKTIINILMCLYESERRTKNDS